MKSITKIINKISLNYIEYFTEIVDTHTITNPLLIDFEGEIIYILSLSRKDVKYISEYTVKFTNRNLQCRLKSTHQNKNSHNSCINTCIH